MGWLVNTNFDSFGIIFKSKYFFRISSVAIAVKRYGEDDSSEIPDSHDASVAAKILQDIGDAKNIAGFSRK